MESDSNYEPGSEVSTGNEFLSKNHICNHSVNLE